MSAREAIRVEVIRGLILHGLPDAMSTSLLFLFALCLLRCATGASLQGPDSLFQGAHVLAQPLEIMFSEAAVIIGRAVAA